MNMTFGPMLPGQKYDKFKVKLGPLSDELTVDPNFALAKSDFKRSLKLCVSVNCTINVKKNLPSIFFKLSFHLTSTLEEI